MSNEETKRQFCQTDVSTSTYFTDAEIKEFKEGSLPFPLIVYEGSEPNNVIEVSEIVSIAGFLTKSRVLWDLKYDENKKYIGYTTEVVMVLVIIGKNILKE